jgi:hypothetical protein
MVNRMQKIPAARSAFDLRAWRIFVVFSGRRKPQLPQCQRKSDAIVTICI